MIVVDASAVADALVVADGTDDLRTYLAAEDLHAPTLLDYEILSVLRGLTLGGHLSAARAEDALADFDDLTIQRWQSAHPLRQRAFELRSNVTAYDATYLALAESLACPLITRDARLARSTGHDVVIQVK